MNLKIDGLNKLNKDITLVANRYMPTGMAKAMVKLLLKVKAEAQRSTPVDMNRLRPSARTQVLKSDAFGVYGTVSFHTRYAVYVHERTKVKHAPGKKAKFLEDAVKKESPKMAKELGLALWSELVGKYPRSGAVRRKLS